MKDRTQIDALIHEKILDQLSSIEARLMHLEAGKGGTGAMPMIPALGSEVDELRKLITHVNDRAASMRLDRQILGAPKYMVRKLAGKATQLPYRSKPIPRDPEKEAAKEAVRKKMTLKTDIVVVCPIYPGGTRAYGGEFVKRRVDAYRRDGLRVGVIEVQPARKEIQRHYVGDAEVVRVNTSGLERVLRLSKPKVICVHHLEPHLWEAITPFAEETPVVIWVHGYEARPWQELAFNFTEEDLKTLKPRLDKANQDRSATMNAAFKHPNVTPVFVSKFMRGIAESFAGQEAIRGTVIHNSITKTDFPYRKKTTEHRKRFLWVRSFSAVNYASDISAAFIEGLSRKPYFDELSFSIYGQGKFFEETTEPLRRFPNVTIEERFLSGAEMRDAHAEHGMMIVPSRWDSQGLTCGEAMHSGLVPVTSDVAALPEFVGPDCAIMAKPDDVDWLVAQYDTLYKEPDLYLKMSRNAARRAESQCGRSSTLAREIKLLKSFLPLPAKVAKSKAPRTFLI